jgi:hypothetical protein
MNNTSATPHRWRFFRAGGFDQVKLESAADLAHLDQLDQKLWVALACPTTGLEFDPRTAALIDTDNDGRIRVPELIGAVQWATAMLKNPDELLAGSSSLPLAAVNDATPDGKQLLASAKHILASLGKKDEAAISTDDASDANRVFANTTLNGDGVIIAESVKEDATKTVFDDIAACMGVVNDRSGKPGIDQAKADAFFAECAAFDAWNKKAEAENILPAGDGTAAAADAVRAIKAKVDDYFGRCKLAAFDPRTVPLVNHKEEDYAAAVAKDISINAAEVGNFPLAHIAAGKPLPLTAGINPAHAAAVAALRDKAVKPLLANKNELTEADWSALQAKLANYEAWCAEKSGAAVEKIGIKRVREILANKSQEKINSLIAEDKALEPEAAAIANVEKLARYVRDLYKLCINFVNFMDLYDGGDPAIFQCGTLYLDQRACHLCLRVEDPAKHATMAGLAGAYLAYCDCVRKSDNEKISIVAIFSQGDDDNLMVGRNGIFYDRKGKDYDATITKIISNPISLRQAFWMPYKKLVRMIEEHIAKRAAAADAASTAKLGTAAASVTTADKTKPAEPPKKVDVGAVAALGVTFSALGTALAYFLGLFKGIPAWKLPLLVIGMMLLISIPSLVLAYIKLRKRNLGPILDANGWAVNARAKINVPFGTSLTEVAKLPPGATMDSSDRFAEKTVLWPKVLAVLFVAWWIWAFLNDDECRLYHWTNGRYGKTPVEVRKREDEERLKKQKEEQPSTAATQPPMSSAKTNEPANTNQPPK